MSDPLDHSSQTAFIQSVLPYALQAQAQTGIPADMMVAINLNEQGWQYSAPGNNYFGIKVGIGWTGATTGAVGTWEDYGNGPVQITDTFRAYNSPADSYVDFINFLNSNSRYAPAMAAFAQTGDAVAWIHGIKDAGYATDPAWPDKIIALANVVDGVIGAGGYSTTVPPSSGGGSGSGGSSPAAPQSWFAANWKLAGVGVALLVICAAVIGGGSDSDGTAAAKPFEYPYG